MAEATYARPPEEEFEHREGVRVETVVARTHPKLSERMAQGFSSGAAEHNPLPTHAKHASNQKGWPTSPEDDLERDEPSPSAPGTLELARIDGALHGTPTRPRRKAPPPHRPREGTALLLGGLPGEAAPGPGAGVGLAREIPGVAGGAGAALWTERPERKTNGRRRTGMIWIAGAAS